LENNNPILEVIDEVRRPFGKPHVECLISIGIGRSKPPSHQCHAFRGIASLGRTEIDPEEQHQEVMIDSSYRNIRGRYYRFNVEEKLSEIGPDRWDRIPDITRLTKEYLLKREVRAAIDRCAQLLEGD
jgi:hypothetical protein